MRNKVITSVVAFMLLLPMVGCDLNPQQSKVVAQNAGLAAAVTWIAYDDPTPEEVEIVKTVLTIIDGVANDNQSGSTYTQVFYPMVQSYLDKAIADGDIKVNEKPLALAGSLAMLNGIDLLFASNPEWAEDKEKALDIMEAFVFGANQGLSLANNDPRMEAARDVASRRAKVWKSE